MTVEAQKDYYNAAPMAMGRKVDQPTAEYNALGGTGTEACANCLFFISPNCCTVVQDWPVPISPTGHSRYWTAIPAMDPTDAPVRVIVVEEDDDEDEPSMGEMSRKAVWSTAMVNDLPDSSFAVISSGGSKDDEGKTTPRSLRHLPYKDASGKVDPAHLRNALSRLPQTTLTASERATAQRKLDAASGKSLLDRIVAAVKSAILGSGGPAVPDGRTTPPAVEGFGSLPSTAGGAFRVYKEADSEAWRWVALVSNKYRDRDNKEGGPEIIEEAAHKEYVSYVDRSGDYPEAWLWHTPGSRWGRADWADYADGFLVMSGTVDKGMEDVAEALSGESLGVSHGFFQKYSDANKGIIGWYRTFEVSALPPEAAANPWTALSVVQKEASMAISASKRAFLEGKLGKERVTALEGDVAALGKALQEAGVEYKDLLNAEGAEQASLSVKDIADALAPTVTAVTALTETVAATKASADAAAGALPGILERLKALEKTDDEKIAVAFTGRTSTQQGYRATTDKSNEAKEGDGVKDKGPEVPAAQYDWLKVAL